MIKVISSIRILTIIAALFQILGFIAFMMSPDNLALAIAMTIVAIGLYLVALAYAIKLYQLKSKQKEDRVRKLEEEVGRLRGK